MKRILIIVVVFVFYTACKTTSNTGVEDIYDVNNLKGSWVLVSMKGADVNEEFGDQKPWINITLEENKVSGFGGCNNYFGGISVSGDSIKIGPLGSTMMACPSMEGEHKYMRLLETVESFEVTDLKLTLMLEGEPVLVYDQKGE